LLRRALSGCTRGPRARQDDDYRSDELSELHTLPFVRVKFDRT
jgi:hypothetical protein